MEWPAHLEPVVTVWVALKVKAELAATRTEAFPSEPPVARSVPPLDGWQTAGRSGSMALR